jgi:hypothetical protein
LRPVIELLLRTAESRSLAPLLCSRAVFAPHRCSAHVPCSLIRPSSGADAVVEDDGADDIMAEILEEERRAREEREAALAAEGVKEAAAPVAGKKKSDMTKLEKLEADVEECESMDLLCSARREKQLKTVEKQRDLEAKLAKIAKKKKKAKAKAKKAA